MAEKKALYHKYRPRKLSDLIGQDHIVKTIENSVKNERLKHAYLFSGIRGTGKTTMARIMALVFNCEDGPSVDYDVDSEFCKAIINNQCPDVVELDAASNSSIEEIRKIRSLAYNNPVMVSKRIFIIDEVHQLRKDAASALLKILEEPPSHTVFILCTTDPQKMLKTIRSRCQRLKLKRVPTNTLTDFLYEVCRKEVIEDVSKDALAIIARASTGSVRDALSFLDAVISNTEKEISVKLVEEIIGYTDASFFYELMSFILSGNKISSIVHLKKAQAIGKDEQEIFHGFLEYVHNMMISKTVKSDEFLHIENSILEGWRKQRDNTPIDDFVIIFRTLEDYMKDIHFKPRLDLTLDACVIDLLNMFEKKKKIEA